LLITHVQEGPAIFATAVIQIVDIAEGPVESFKPNQTNEAAL